jgi:hypothetical protein
MANAQMERRFCVTLRASIAKLMLPVIVNDHVNEHDDVQLCDERRDDVLILKVRLKDFFKSLLTHLRCGEVLVSNSLTLATSFFGKHV